MKIAPNFNSNFLPSMRVFWDRIKESLTLDCGATEPYVILLFMSVFTTIIKSSFHITSTHVSQLDIRKNILFLLNKICLMCRDFFYLVCVQLCTVRPKRSKFLRWLLPPKINFGPHISIL